MFIVGITVEGIIGRKDVLLELDSNARWESALQVLAKSVAQPTTEFHYVIHRSGRALSEDTPLRTLDLRWGDVLVQKSGTSVYLEGGPRFIPIDGSVGGSPIPLGEGVHTIGRDSDMSDIVIDDPSVSRRHASIAVTSSHIEVTDNNSSNGTTLNGLPITGSQTILVGDVVAFGMAAFRYVTATSNLAGDGRSSFEGIIPFNRPPRLLDDTPTTRVGMDAPPTKVESRKIPIATYAAPIIGAGASAGLSGKPQMMLIALVSPAMYLAQSFGERRSGAKNYTREAAAFRAAVDQRVSEAKQALQSYHSWAERRWPKASYLAPLVHELDERLWWRRPQDDDFLQVRLGVASRISPIEFAMPQGGADELRTYVDEQFRTVLESQVLPLPLSLRDIGTLGVVGTELTAMPFLKSLVLQIAAEQSHRDVAIDIVAPDRSEQFDDLKWLPHVTARGLDAALVALNDETEVTTLQKLRAIKEDRLAKDGFGREALAKSPHHVVIICPPIITNRAQISEFLTDLADSSMTVIWVAPERGLLPGECSTVIQLNQRGGASLSSERLSTEFTPELLTSQSEVTLGRNLAALRDTSAAESSRSLPDYIALLDLPSFRDVTTDSLVARWQRPEEGLVFPIGVSEEGEFRLSIITDGPHALVAGMTGAGKSELLQTAIASLALSYSPDFVNFVLVDYKGGSAFKSCRTLPHTVGFVTDLDDGLAERAIISLNAELRRREHIITNEGDAKDILEYRRLHPHTPMASLIIIIDEFAFLVKELPNFVDRLVDIAQRGRSLGVHLVLATQRPSGVISAQIQANTNLRIALRVASTADSSDVVDSPIAATILPTQRGRAFLKTGPKKPLEVQAAYAGRIKADAVESGGRAMTFNLSKMDLRALEIAAEHDASAPSDLDTVVALCQSAVESLGLVPPPAPWLEPLPDQVSFQALTTFVGPDELPLGLIDIPDAQRRGVLTYRPERDQNVMIVGGPRTGKTTTLISVAALLARQPFDRAAWMYGLDFGHAGLQALSQLPTWGGTATATSMESVARLIDLLDALSIDRQGITEAQRATLRPVVTFIDNWSALTAALQNVEFAPYADSLQRLIADGRGIGLYFIVTGDREGIFSATVASAIGQVWTFRLSNAQDLGARHRESGGRLLSLPVGRAFETNGLEVQFVFPAPLVPVETTAEVYGLAQPGAQPRLRLLPDSYPLNGLEAAQDLHGVPLGIEESWRQVNVNFADNPYFVIAGNPRAGKSTLAGTLTEGIRRTGAVTHAYLLASRRTPLVDLEGWNATAVSSETVQVLLPEIRNIVADPNSRVLLVVEDADDWADVSNSLNPGFDGLLKMGIDHHLLFICTVSISRAQRTFSSWLGSVKTQQSGFLIGGGAENGDIFQVRLPRNLSPNEPPGRGYLITPRGNIKAHVAQFR